MVSGVCAFSLNNCQRNFRSGYVIVVLEARLQTELLMKKVTLDEGIGNAKLCLSLQAEIMQYNLFY